MNFDQKMAVIAVILAAIIFSFSLRESKIGICVKVADEFCGFSDLKVKVMKGNKVVGRVKIPSPIEAYSWVFTKYDFRTKTQLNKIYLTIKNKGSFPIKVGEVNIIEEGHLRIMRINDIIKPGEEKDYVLYSGFRLPKVVTIIVKDACGRVLFRETKRF